MVFPELLAEADWKKIDTVLQKIEALSDEVVTQIVQRIPNDYMKPDHKEVVLNGLLARRTLIRPVLANQLGK